LLTIGTEDIIDLLGMHTDITKSGMVIILVNMKDIFMEIDILGTAPDIIIKSTITIEKITNIGITPVTRDIRRRLYTILVFKRINWIFFQTY